MNREEATKRATQLVEQMTVEEMASQLRYDAKEIERLNVPEYNWWGEGLHGVARAGTATMFPQAIGLGATFDKDLLKEIGHCIGVETRAKYNEFIQYEDRDIYKGLTLWSPNVNLFRDPRWGRGQETYGEDPELISRLGVEFIKGLQGDKEYLLTAACAKHFAVHSGPEEQRHYFDAKTSKKELFETYLPQFKACVKEAKVESVMGAYNRTNGEPCCAHSYLMGEVLRDKWEFEGHYVSDCWAIKDFHEHHKVTNSPTESVALALKNGCDLNCGCTYERIIDAYEDNDITLEQIKKSAIRLFTTRYMLGMFDKTEYDLIGYDEVESKEHIELAKKATCESVVLLKNNGVLPLDKSKIKTIGVIGPNADSRKALIGNYHGTSSQYITVLDGIRTVVSDETRIMYAQGCHLNFDREEPLAKSGDRISEAKTVAKYSDLVILCLGLDESLEGEEGDTGNAYASGDKKDLKLPKSQQLLVQAIIESKVPFVACIMAGSALDLTEIDQHAEAILQVWYPGARGGREVAEILFGSKQPGGKLPITFYKDLEGMPEFTDYSMAGRTYRFIEKTPLYPFGYGLTYGDSYVESAERTEQLSFQSCEETDCMIRAKVLNSGTYLANEVLQVYVHVQGTNNEVLHPKLAAFQRVQLDAGEEKEVQIQIPKKAFKTFNEEGENVFDGSGANIYVGFGQPDERTEQLLQRKAIVIKI